MGVKHGKKKSRKPILPILVIGNSMAGKTALIQCYEYIAYSKKFYQDLDSNLKLTTSLELKVVYHTIKEDHNEEII